MQRLLRAGRQHVALSAEIRQQARYARPAERADLRRRDTPNGIRIRAATLGVAIHMASYDSPAVAPIPVLTGAAEHRVISRRCHVRPVRVRATARSHRTEGAQDRTQHRRPWRELSDPF